MYDLDTGLAKRKDRTWDRIKKDNQNMRLTMTTAAITICFLMGLAIASCGQTAATPKSSAQPDKPQVAAPEKIDTTGLSEADRKLVEKQKICPVSGQRLGSMGAPFKLTYKDRVVFLCCEGCKEDFEKEPEKYLAKLDKQGK
jgi:YHS domain-containing protein